MKMFWVYYVLILVTLSSCLHSSLKSVKQSQVPIMGWSSWNNYRIHINDSIIRAQVDAIASNGMKDAGYQFVNIDDGFYGGRSENGSLYCDSLKFPNGMKSVADYIHSKGLKAGIYTDAGRNTCGSIWDADPNGFGVGAFGHEQQDMNLYLKEWGFDFIKVDWCGGQQQNLDEEAAYTSLVNVVRQTRPDAVFNICRWQFPGTWAIDKAQSWRISGDINATFGSICHIIDKNAFLAPYASAGHFNDMDMLQVGRGMSVDEDKAHFTMWCMMASPLLAGNDLAAMSRQTLEILTNREVIDINQDVAAFQAERVFRSEGVEVWVKPLGGRMSGKKAVAVLNRNNNPIGYELDFLTCGLKGVTSVRDLWMHDELSVANNRMTTDVAAHGVRIFRVSGSEVEPQTYQAEYAFLNWLGAKDGPAFVETDAFAGGYGVQGLGGHADNWMEFRHVFSKKRGEVKLILSPLIEPSSTLVVLVNGKINSHYDAGSWTVKLEKGFNTIRLIDDVNPIPVLDEMTIVR